MIQKTTPRIIAAVLLLLGSVSFSSCDHVMSALDSVDKATDKVTDPVMRLNETTKQQLDNASSTGQRLTDPVADRPVILSGR